MQLLPWRIVVVEAAVQTAIWTVQHALALPVGVTLLAAVDVPLPAPVTAVPVPGSGILIWIQHGSQPFFSISLWHRQTLGLDECPGSRNKNIVISPSLCRSVKRDNGNV
jgi:hypothetical protein